MKCDFRTVHSEFFLVEVYPLLAVVSVGCVFVFLEEDVALDLGDVLDEKGNDLPELIDAFP